MRPPLKSAGFTLLLLLAPTLPISLSRATTLPSIASALRTPNPALSTPHSVLPTPHSAPPTPHSALRTLLAQTTPETREQTAQRLLDQGQQQAKKEDWQGAVATYQQALAIYQQLNDQNGIGTAQNLTGNAFYRLEQYDKALIAYQQSLTAFQKAGNQAGVAQVWQNIGGVYSEQKQYSQALAAYQQALTLSRQLQNPKQEADILSDIGYVYSSQVYAFLDEQNYSEARKFAEQSLAAFRQQLDIAQKIPDKQREAYALLSIGQAYGKQGYISYGEGAYDQAKDLYLQAIKFYEQALAIGRELNSPSFIKLALARIAGQYVDIGLALNRLGHWTQKR